MMLRVRTKLTLLTIFLTLGSLGLAGQEVMESSHPIKYHEVRLNLFALPFASEFSAEYEYATAPNLSIGCTMSAYIGDKSACRLFFPTFGVMPYGRWYFGGVLFSMKKPNAGFFLEANSSIAYNDNLRNVHYEYSSETEKWEKKIEERSGVSWGIGLGGGFKLVTRSNWSGEISCRLGRNIVKVSKWNIAYIYPAISVGYRF